MILNLFSLYKNRFQAIMIITKINFFPKFTDFCFRFMLCEVIDFTLYNYLFEHESQL